MSAPVTEVTSRAGRFQGWQFDTKQLNEVFEAIEQGRLGPALQQAARGTMSPVQQQPALTALLDEAIVPGDRETALDLQRQIALARRGTSSDLEAADREFEFEKDFRHRLVDQEERAMALQDQARAEARDAEQLQFYRQEARIAGNIADAN